MIDEKLGMLKLTGIVPTELVLTFKVMYRPGET